MDKVDAVRNLAVQLEERAKEIQKDLDEAKRSICEEKEAWETEKKEMAKRYQINDNIIDINAGGTSFTTYKSVLCKIQGSMLEAMFSGRHPIAKDSHGKYFIDCDGEAFGYILNYLRRGQMVWPESQSLCKRISLDLQFFGIVFPLFVDSSILEKQPELRESLISLFPTASEAKLLYKASVDGWSAQSFHAKTNGPLNTVTLVQVGTHVFGGYSQLPFNSSTHGAYAPSQPNSFLFSLSNPTKTHTGIKFPNTGTSGKYSTYYHNDYSATFGGGHDIMIANNANTSTASYTNLGHGYTHPTFAYGSDSAKTFFCGSYSFTPNEVEVFTIQQS